MSKTGEVASTLLDERYAASRNRGFDRRFAWIAAVGLLLAGAVVVVFGGWHKTSTIEFRTISYSVSDDQTVKVVGQVTAPADQDVVCAIEALSESYATVGWKLIELPAGGERSRSIDTNVMTTSPATTGSLRECWVLEHSV